MNLAKSIQRVSVRPEPAPALSYSQGLPLCPDLSPGVRNKNLVQDTGGRWQGERHGDLRGCDSFHCFMYLQKKAAHLSAGHSVGGPRLT